MCVVCWALPRAHRCSSDQQRQPRNCRNQLTFQDAVLRVSATLSLDPQLESNLVEVLARLHDTTPLIIEVAADSLHLSIPKAVPYSTVDTFQSLCAFARSIGVRRSQFRKTKLCWTVLETLGGLHVPQPTATGCQASAQLRLGAPSTRRRAGKAR